MKILVRLFLILICALNLAWAGEQPDPRTMSFQQLDFSIPHSKRLLLDNHIPVYLLPDHEIPLVTITAMIRTGSVYDPADKSGLAALTGRMLRNGGTKTVLPDQLDDELEFMASAVESYFGTDSGIVTMSCLSRNLTATLDIFADLLFKPGFDSKRLQIVRQQMLEDIRRQNDDPKELADRELEKLIYAGHPLGYFPTENSINAIQRSDLVDFHKKFVNPENIIIAVSGDVDEKKLLPLLNQLLGRYANKDGQPLPQIPAVQGSFRPQLQFVQKKVNQTVIRFGHLGITKDDPDLYAVRVLDYILGGSFTSRLMTEVRTNQGLAYNVGSSFDVGRRFTGSFTAQTETRANATIKTIKLMQNIIEDIRQQPVTAQELKLAKDSIINSFLFGFTTPQTVVSQQMRLEFYNYQSDFLEKYREKIAAVTAEDVLRAAKRLLHPDAFKLVVVGDESAFDEPLSTLNQR